MDEKVEAAIGKSRPGLLEQRANLKMAIPGRAQGNQRLSLAWQLGEDSPAIRRLRLPAGESAEFLQLRLMEGN